MGLPNKIVKTLPDLVEYDRKLLIRLQSVLIQVIGNKESKNKIPRTCINPVSRDVYFNLYVLIFTIFVIQMIRFEIFVIKDGCTVRKQSAYL
jgi:hypothetical protein